MSENPKIINKIRNNEIKPVQLNDPKITDKTKLNKLETLQIQKLQEFADDNEIGRTG